MKPNMIKKWSIALLVAAGAAGLTGCEGIRVDEGASVAQNSGNVSDRSALKANLSGTVVDDFGQGLSGVTVYAYGQSTTTDEVGNWILQDVPVTGVNINSTAQNLEQTTDVTTSGSIYITYSKAGYAQYRSQVSNPSVITHYGTAGGNPNSIVVDGLVASDKAQLPALANTITGVVVDRGSYYTQEPIGEYATASGISLRLVPAQDVVNGTYGSDAGNCVVSCGFYAVGELTASTDSNGAFSFGNVPKIPGGYILRVDNPGYRPVPRPNDGSGYSYDYEGSGTGSNDWAVSVSPDVAQNYWSAIDFDVKTASGTVTYLDSLYVGDYLVAASNSVEGITVGGKYGTPDENSGEANDEGHNSAIVFSSANSIAVDSNLVNLTTTPLKFIFSGDMVPYAAGELPARAIVVFDSTGAQLAVDTANTSVSGRTLTLALDSTPTVGTTIYVRLHKDVFTDMSGQRLVQTVDPNDAQYSGNSGDSDPAEIVNSNSFYGEYAIVYSDPLIVPDPVADFAQGNINVAIPATASLATAGLDAVQASDARIEELYDAILVRTGTVGQAVVDGSTVDFEGDVATVGFTAVNGATYRLRVRDAGGTLLTEAASGLATQEGTGTATIVVGGTPGTATFLDFVASVTDATGAASVTLTGVAADYTVSIVRLNDFGDEVASSAVTVTLADNFEPHVAIQNSNYSGQDTLVGGAKHDGGGTTGDLTIGAAGAADSADRSQMLFACGIGRSDDNGEQEVGDEVFYFPKLNLSASLYDLSSNRSHIEQGGALSTSTTAEDIDNALTGALIVNSRNTPLLATVAATESAVGTTATGRSDRYYNSTDYDTWGVSGTTPDADSCNYYTAAFDTNTGLFLDRWDVASDNSGALVTPVVLADSVTDDNSDQADFPTTGYTVIGTRAVALADGTTASANIVEGPTGCGALGSNVYAFDREVILNMTEAVSAPTDLASFKTTEAACGLTNVVAGSELDTNLTAISSASSGWNNDHLVLSLTDWRTIDDSEHFTDETQNEVANEVDEGSSTNDLLQIVGITDANGVEATAGNGRGVLIVDATPPMATSLSHDGSTITVKFDQTINLSDVGVGVDEFTLVGEGGVQYDFNLGTDPTDSTVGTVERSTAYIDRYGHDGIAANTAVTIAVTPGVNADDNVPSSVANSQLTITINDTAADFSDYFNELSYGSAGAVAGTATTAQIDDDANKGGNVAGPAALGFFMDYPALQDINFNSWAAVETYDEYDDSGSPRILGADGQGPRLQTITVDDDNGGTDISGIDADTGFLHRASGLSVSSIHAALGDNTDTDTVYTASTTGAITNGATDTELAYVLGYGVAGVATQNVVAADTVRVIIKLSETMAAANIGEAIAYYYDVDNTGAAGAGLTGGNSIIAMADAPAGSTATGGGGGVGGDVGFAADGSLVIELPALGAAVVTQGDKIVIQNILVDNHFYSIHIDVPQAKDTTVETVTAPAPSTTEAGITPLSTTVYKQVYLDMDTDFVNLQAGTNILSTTVVPSPKFTFREQLASVSNVSWSVGSDEDGLAADDAVGFAASASVTTGDTEKVTVTLNAITATSNAVTESDDRYVGHGSQLSFTTTDHSNNSSNVVVILNKEHGQSLGNVDGVAASEEENVILNIISGAAID